MTDKILKDLINRIRFLNKKYYIDNESLVSDYEYDLLLDRARMLCTKKSNDSLEDIISSLDFAIEDSALDLYKHTQPMLSLNNIYNEEQFNDFIKRIYKKCSVNNIDLIAQHKIDGLSLSLVYKKGLLCHALTRGDGMTGEDVWHNVQDIKSIPRVLPEKYSLGTTIIRGEVYLSKKDFHSIQERSEYAYSNARNMASGLLRSKKYTPYTSLLLFSAYFLWNDTISISYEEQKIDILQFLGFNSPGYLLASNYQDCISFYYDTLKKRDSIAYAIDGLVYKVNKVNFQELLSFSSSAPRWSIAYKCPALSKESILRSVSFSVGRNGIITPVGHIDSVYIDGVCIQKASLHNFQNIADKNFALGDKVSIERAGDVIPYISHQISKGDKRERIAVPLYCSCPLRTKITKKSSLDGSQESAYYHCNGSTMCPYQQYGHLIHFVSRDAFNIKGLGETVINFLMNKNWLIYPYQLFQLSQYYDEWIKEKGFGKKNIRFILDNIEKKRKISLSIFLYSLGIRGLGKNLSRTVASFFGSWDAFYANMSSSQMYETLLSIEGIGESIVYSIDSFFQNWKMRRNIFFLLREIDVESSALMQSKSAEESVVFTGSFPQYSRASLEKMAHEKGFLCRSSVSRQTNIVIAGEKSGKKYQDALSYNITIMSLSEWLRYLSTRHEG